MERCARLRRNRQHCAAIDRAAARQLFAASSAGADVQNRWHEWIRLGARLLGQAVRRFNGKRIESHWSFTAFCACRRVIGVAAELQILLLTELVSTAYYRVLRRHVDDAAVKQMCCLILRDEAGHVSFHRDRLAAAEAVPGVIWLLQFWVCGYAAATMLWANHGPCLCAVGGSRAEYYHEVRFEISRFVRRLLRNSMGSTRNVFPTSPIAAGQSA